MTVLKTGSVVLLRWLFSSEEDWELPDLWHMTLLQHVTASAMRMSRSVKQIISCYMTHIIVVFSPCLSVSLLNNCVNMSVNQGTEFGLCMDGYHVEIIPEHTIKEAKYVW